MQYWGSGGQLFAFTWPRNDPDPLAGRNQPLATTVARSGATVAWLRYGNVLNKVVARAHALCLLRQNPFGCPAHGRASSQQEALEAA